MEYIIEKESSVDSDGKPAEKIKLVPCRSSKMSPEIEETLVKELEKHFEKEDKMRSAFLGIFACKIQNGRLRIPWDIDTHNDRFVWFIVKNGHEIKIVFTFSDHSIGVNDGDIWRQGDCEFSETGDWILPKIALCFIKEKNCVWVGSRGFAELMSEREYQKMIGDFNTEDLLMQLSDT